MPPPLPTGGDGLALITALFRQILRLHRKALPGPMRSLGDSYAHHEFSSHLRGKTTRPQWEAFVHEWQHYTTMLNGQAEPGAGAGVRSGDLSPDILGSMSKEQQQKMQELQQEMAQLGKPEPEEQR